MKDNINCYNEFARIYDELINKDVDYNSWASRIMTICRKYGVKREKYLDIGCGTGNLTEKVAPNFENIWCVDLSSDMLAEAEKKFRGKNLKLNLIHQNMIDLKLNRTFDLITCCLDSVNYIIEEKNLVKYFKAVFRHLDDDGLFIFDINSYYKLTKVLGNNLYDYDDDKITYIWENSMEEEIIYMYLIFFIKRGDLYTRFDEQHQERAYKCEYIEEIVKKCGFNLLEKLDNYGEKHPGKNSERIVYVLNKKENNI